MPKLTKEQKEYLRKRKLHRQFVVASITLILVLSGIHKYQISNDYMHFIDRGVEILTLWIVNIILVLLENL